jgi:signal transduction histidine kinase
MLMRKIMSGAQRSPGRIGMLVVFVPLLLLLGFQYRWMSKLEHGTMAVRQATCDSFLEALTSYVDWRYHSMAKALIDPPAEFFIEGELEKTVAHWRDNSIEPVRHLFLLDLTDSAESDVLLFDAVTRTPVDAAGSDEGKAILAARSRLLDSCRQSGQPTDYEFMVDEDDPAHRILYNPIRDDSLRVVGVCGMVLDEEYLTCAVLSERVDRSLPHYFGEAHAPRIGVEILDGTGNVALSWQEVRDDMACRSRSMSFVFTDWTIRVDPAGYGIPDRDRVGSMLNRSLSVILVIVLIAGTYWSLRAAGRAVRLSEMKADFVANVSHELRTPIASIRTFAEHLRSGRAGGGEQVRQYGEYIEAESQRLCRLCDRILDFSRIESAQKEYALRRTDLGAVVAETVRSFESESRTRSNDIRISCVAPDRDLPQLDLDADAVSRALDNLLDNAVKYSRLESPGESTQPVTPEQGAVAESQIEVRLERNSDAVALRVSDRGIGIAREDIDHIFERFHRAGGSLVHDVKGSGLGLSIVQHIMEAHGGEVLVDSRPGEGSTFSLLFPIPRSG